MLIGIEPFFKLFSLFSFIFMIFIKLALHKNKINIGFTYMEAQSSHNN